MLRIDDTDQARSTKAYEDGIHTDLSWLGLDHDLTAHQSARFDLYDEIADKLRAEGLLYPCYETADDLERKRKLQRARGLPPIYDRAALDLSDDDRKAFEAEGRRPHWRYKLSQQPVVWDDLIRGETIVDTKNVSDPVLIREDGQYLYTLPSCIDDIDFAITHVIRGEDHVTNAAVQVEIMSKLLEMGRGDGHALPAFAHHSLLVGADGQGLSKRIGSLSIEGMRDDAMEPEAITSLLAKLGTADPIVPQTDIMTLAKEFDFEKVGRAPARFDMDELWALNAKLLHDLPFEGVAGRLTGDTVSPDLWDAVRSNIKKVSDVYAWQAIVDKPIDPVIEDAEFTKAASTCVPDGPLDDQSWSAFVALVKDKTGAKGKKLFMPLRLALTGKSHGPEMGALFALIGAERARARLCGERA